jgi:replicative DNA helicase
MQKPSDRRVGALVLSLEMGEEPSNVRLAQANTGIDGGRMREGRTDDDDLRKITTSGASARGSRSTSTSPAPCARASCAR